jgi:hypothetical protein
MAEWSPDQSDRGRVHDPFGKRRDPDRVSNYKFARCNHRLQPTIHKKELPAILMSIDQSKYSFGHGLPEKETQWLSQVIDVWLDANHSQVKGGMISLLE